VARASRLSPKPQFTMRIPVNITNWKEDDYVY